MEWASIPLALLGSLYVFISGWKKLIYGQASSRHGCKTLQDPGFCAFWLFFIRCWSRERCSGIGQCFLHFSVLTSVCPSLWLTLNSPAYTVCPLSQSPGCLSSLHLQRGALLNLWPAQCCCVLLQVLLSSISWDQRCGPVYVPAWQEQGTVPVGLSL